MSGYDALRAMRKGSDPDPDFEAWKKDINPNPRADPESDNQWQMRINATKGDLGYGEKDENGDWVPDESSIYPHMKQLKAEGGEENEDEYRECIERGSTYTLYEDEPDLYYAATPTPIKPTTQTTIDAHAAGGDNVWQRGQTARQQAAMARDAQQARDLARPYRMAPQVAYKQAQEEQNMEPTQKSAMLELPPIGEMIKGKRENPRENLAEFQNVKKSIANRATAEYLHEKYKPDPGYLSERRNEREGPHQPSVHSALNAIQSQANEQDRIDKERYNIAETGLQRGQADAAKLIEEMQAKGMSAEEIAEAMGNISNDAAPEDYRFTGDPNHDYRAWINGMGYAESLGEHRNDWIVGNDDNPGEDPVVSAVRNNVRHQESLTNPAIQDERLGINRSQGMNRETHEFVDASKESAKKSVQKYPNELPPISSMIKGKRENPRENLSEYHKSWHEES